ncbi:MAG: beta-N-acetylhexosaminidase [Oceanipulchritudo sp.]
MKPYEKLAPCPRNIRPLSGFCEWSRVRVERITGDDLPPEGYRLLVSPRTIRMEASGETGFLRAGQTLHQLRLVSGGRCPCVEIEDEPDLAVRGYMLDISRCKVPRMDHLFRLVDLLSLFKYNQLQLYTEHTFAYEGHERVWAAASPMTPEEIRQLDARCGECGIELVPNQNALGHMERWLRYPEYHYLAESPGGFHHPFQGWLPYGTVLYPDGEAVSFIDGLLGQLLPCFGSQWVHLGCDEPWELGQGRSQERVEREGRHSVFRDHLLRLHGLAGKRGKRMLFWSDELRSEPERVRELPGDIVPVVWGYEKDHDFDSECAVYAGAGYDFLVAPGDSSWNSFTGRFDTCWQNVRNAARAAREHGAMGMLLTSWGDHGHQQTWPTQLPGLVHFAQAAWNAAGISDGSLVEALNGFVFLDPTGETGRICVELARTDRLIPARVHRINNSFPFDALFEPKARIRKAMRPHGAECLFSALSHLDTLGRELHKSAPSCRDAPWLMDEFRLAMEMTRTGLHRADAFAKGHDASVYFSDWPDILKRYRIVWLRRSREGGLEESLGLLRQLRGGGAQGSPPDADIGFPDKDT